MSNELISKKDLLELTKISYGQLYRWKRKNLIPEEWFVRKSTFTGQETFFPKEKILERIEKIQTMKENLSLDELADMFSPNVTKRNLTREEIVQRKIGSEPVIDFYLDNQHASQNEFGFSSIYIIFILENLLQSGQITLDEGRMLIQVLTENYNTVVKKNSEIIFIRKLGVTSCFILTNQEDIYFEKGTKVIARISLMNGIEELKERLL